MCKHTAAHLFIINMQNRQSNSGHKNISFDVSRQAWRLELRTRPGHSKTARFKTLEAALAKRAEWYQEREQYAQEEKAKRDAEKQETAFSIIKKDITIVFD